MVALAATMQFALLVSFFAATTGVFTPGVPAKAKSRKAATRKAATRKAATRKAFPKFDDKDVDDKGPDYEKECVDVLMEVGKCLFEEDEKCLEEAAECDPVVDACEVAYETLEEKCNEGDEKEEADECDFLLAVVESDDCKDWCDDVAAAKLSECIKDETCENEAEKFVKTGCAKKPDACSKALAACGGDELPKGSEDVCKELEDMGCEEPEQPKRSKDESDSDVEIVQDYKCTKRDKTAMFKLGAGSAPGSFPHSIAKCANQAFQIFTGLNYTSFSLCMKKQTRITKGCAACFAGASASQAFWCGGACMFSWCSQPCLACTWAYRATHLKSCVGFAAPEPQSC